MLIPLTRKKFEQLIPRFATGPQYVYYWGKFPDFLKRLLISVVSLVVLYFGGLLIFQTDEVGPIRFLLVIVALLYWLWAPVYFASRRNAKYRKYPYSGFWQGKVLDVFVTEEAIGTEETVNKRGELVIVENRERRLNLEIGDETGFSTEIQVPLRKQHKGITPGQIVQMIVMSNMPDLSRFAKISDIYIPYLDLWVSDYPYLAKEDFVEVSRQLQASQGVKKSQKSKTRKQRQ